MDTNPFHFHSHSTLINPIFISHKSYKQLHWPQLIEVTSIYIILAILPSLGEYRTTENSDSDHMFEPYAFSSEFLL